MDIAKHLEVEIKFALKNPDETLDFLQRHATFVEDTFQKDTYFLPSHRNFLEVTPIAEWLRIRESNEGNSVVYKNRSVKDGISQDHCTEYETPIDNPEDMKKIFSVLDIKPLVIVNKKRKLFTYKQVEIAVDEVDELGRFIEFEAKGEFADIDEAKNHLYTIAEEIGTQLENQDKKGYPYVLLERKGIIKN